MALYMNLSALGQKLIHILGDILRGVLEPAQLRYAGEQRNQARANKTLQRRPLTCKKCHGLPVEK